MPQYRLGETYYGGKSVLGWKHQPNPNPLEKSALLLLYRKRATLAFKYCAMRTRRYPEEKPYWDAMRDMMSVLLRYHHEKERQMDPVYIAKWRPKR